MASSSPPLGSPTRRILIVEDEILIALDLSSILQGLGYEVVGCVGDSSAAREAAARPGGVDLALVDLNLQDGPSGPALGRDLSRRGVTVLHLTANPGQAALGVDGPVGILPKPYSETGLAEAVAFALSVRAGRPIAVPEGLRVLPRPAERSAAPAHATRPRGLELQAAG